MEGGGKRNSVDAGQKDEVHKLNSSSHGHG